MPAHADFTLWRTGYLSDVTRGKCAEYMYQAGPGSSNFTAATLSFEGYDTNNNNAKCWYFKGSLSEDRSQFFFMNGRSTSTYGRLYKEIVGVPSNYSYVYIDGISTPPTLFTVTAKCQHDITINTWGDFNYQTDYNRASGDRLFKLRLNSIPDLMQSAQIFLRRTSPKSALSTVGSWCTALSQ